MRKIFIICLLSLLAPFISGKEIFIYRPGDEEGKSCQAVRIKDNWFLTAAHCVSDICNTACKIKMQIAGEIIETSQKNVFWLNERRKNNASYDLALINFQGAKIREDFQEPQIIIADNSLKFNEPKILDRGLEINYNFGNVFGGILSRYEVFYGPKSKTIFTQDLGLFHGLSGAGVVTDKGELIAITSATAGRGNNARFSVFSVFDERVESFLRQKMPTLYFKRLSSSDFKDLTKSKQDKEILISLDNE